MATSHQSSQSDSSFRPEVSTTSRLEIADSILDIVHKTSLAYNQSIMVSIEKLTKVLQDEEEAKVLRQQQKQAKMEEQQLAATEEKQRKAEAKAAEKQRKAEAKAAEKQRKAQAEEAEKEKAHNEKLERQKVKQEQMEKLLRLMENIFSRQEADAQAAAQRSRDDMVRFQQLSAQAERERQTNEAHLSRVRGERAELQAISAVAPPAATASSSSAGPASSSSSARPRPEEEIGTPSRKRSKK